MLYREIIAVCPQIHTKHINTLCGLNVEFVNVKPGGTNFFRVGHSVVVNINKLTINSQSQDFRDFCS